MEIIDPIQSQAPIQAPTVFSSQQPVGSRKKYMVMGLVVAILLLIVGIGGYLLGIRSNLASNGNNVNERISVTPQSDSPPVVDLLPSKVPTPTTNPTADWRIYLNKDWNLTIKYPPNLFKKDYNDLAYFTFEPEPTEGWGMMGASSAIRISKVEPFFTPGLKFDALSKAVVGSDVKEAQEGVDIKVTKIKNTKIGNYDAVEYIHDGITPPKTDGRGPIGYSRILLVKVNNDTFIELKNSSYEVQTTKNNDEIFNQMISTLQIK